MRNLPDVKFDREVRFNPTKELQTRPKNKLKDHCNASFMIDP